MSEKFAFSISTDAQVKKTPSNISENLESFESACTYIDIHINELFDLKFKDSFSDTIDKKVKLYNLIRQSKKANSNN